MIKEIANGKTALVQYSVARISRNKESDDLFIIFAIKNVGAKHVSLKGKDIPGLSLWNKDGEEVLYSTTSDPAGLHFGGVSVMTISINSHNMAGFPWTMQFENADGLTPFKISAEITKD